MTAVPLLDRVLSPDGWPYASSAPVEPGDPGRFVALFGRDSLITSLQLVPVRPDVAIATVRVHAALQGVRDDVETDEEPGKIVHEYRPDAPAHFLERGWPVRDGVLRYYGSADGTSWFLVVLGALARAGERAVVAELDDAWRAAGGWLERSLARGGGFVRYGRRHSTGGLAQQGWRDASDPLVPPDRGGGILREDGTIPAPPLADADCQAVALAALRTLHELSGEERWLVLARALAQRVEAAFGPETMAVEADDREVRGAGSQLGWLLWAGALSPAAAERAAVRLAEPDVLTPFGLRTLSPRHPRFEPHAYHRGSVWPFDSWLGWGGLRAAGHTEAAERVRRGVLDAVARLGYADELYAVVDGEVLRTPRSNRVQAWTVGARWALEHRWDGGALAPRTAGAKRGSSRAVE